MLGRRRQSGNYRDLQHEPICSNQPQHQQTESKRALRWSYIASSIQNDLRQNNAKAVTPNQQWSIYQYKRSTTSKQNM